MAKAELAKREDLLPATFDYGEDYDAGFENNGPGEMQIPFLSLLQGLSPQCATVEGAKPGRFFNTVTEEVVDPKTTPILFVPAHYEHVYVEWKPNRGGFVARHPLDDARCLAAVAASPEFGKAKSEEGNSIQETFYLYGVLCPEGEDPQPALLAFTSTKIKVFKKWNTTVGMVQVPTADGGKRRPPRFSHLVQIGSVSQTNSKGTFFNLELKPANGSTKLSLLPPDDVRFLAAKAVRDLVLKGAARVDFDKQQDAPADAEVF